MAGTQGASCSKPATPRVGGIGYGYWGNNLVRNFHALGAIAAIRNEDAETTEGLDALIGDIGIEGIVVSVPATGHYALTKAALAAGKHVFVEKSLALELDQAAELVEIAESSDLTLMVGHLLQYHHALSQAERTRRQRRSRPPPVHLLEPSKSRQGTKREEHLHRHCRSRRPDRRYPGICRRRPRNLQHGS